MGERPAVDRVERERIGDPVASEMCLQGGDALAHVTAAPATAARHRRVARIVVHALEPDHPAPGGAQGQGPVQVHPEVPASLGVADGVGWREADGAAHAAPPTPSGSGGRGGSDPPSRAPRPLRPPPAPPVYTGPAGRAAQAAPRAGRGPRATAINMP